MYEVQIDAALLFDTRFPLSTLYLDCIQYVRTTGVVIVLSLLFFRPSIQVINGDTTEGTAKF